MRKKPIGIILAIIIMISFLAGCGEDIEVNRAEEVYESEAETCQADEESETGTEAGKALSQEDSFAPQPFVDDLYYKGSEQLPKEITEQIEIYVNQREVWLPEPQKYMPDYYYAWNDLNLDGTLELICSYCQGSGRYSTSYVYAVNSDREVECVAKLDREDSPDLLWGVELYADTQKGQEPRHFYIRTQDNLRDGSDYHRTDMVFTFTAELTEWQQERIRSCIEKYRDASHSELVDAEYRDSEREPISQKEWEHLEEEFLKDKELITADFVWDRLWSYTYYTYDEIIEITLSDKELGEALETLYISWKDTYAFSYDYWTDFQREWNLPYTDEKTFELIKKTYAEVDFFGEFKIGDENVYDEYIRKYYELLQNNMPVYDPETNMYILVMEYDDFGRYYEDYGYGQTNFKYFLFDIDGDKLPEMAIQTYVHGYYVFDYNADTEEYSVWYPMGSSWYAIIGTRKVQWQGNGHNLAFYQLDERGEEECETFFFSRYKNSEIYLCMVMLPKYADSSKEITVTEEMKNQGVFERSSGQWYFRITQEQFDELSENYREAYELAQKQQEGVSYTYEELFGSLIQ